VVPQEPKVNFFEKNRNIAFGRFEEFNLLSDCCENFIQAEVGQIKLKNMS